MDKYFLSTDFVNRGSERYWRRCPWHDVSFHYRCKHPGQFVGKAPKASFHLFKNRKMWTLNTSIEEFNWVCGAERADSAGSDVITSSLGYNTFDNPTFDHTHSQMNGNTTISYNGGWHCSQERYYRLNAAGNEGTNGWHYIIAPADGDSVVAAWCRE